MSLVSVQFSLYTLDGRDMAPIIAYVEKALMDRGLSFQVGAMSTMIWGDSRDVFTVLETLFTHVAEKGAVVMNVTVSNCCPLPSDEA